MIKKNKNLKKLFYILALVALCGCYSNNCPVNNLVRCNYMFYDSEGTSITYNYAITVSAIMPGTKTVYVYRKLGSTNVVSDKPRQDLLDNEYTESKQTVRRDTVLINKMSGAQFAQVPMSYFNPVDTLLFSYENISLPDTIYVEHVSYPHVDLPECGSYRYHDLKSIRSTNNAIDHIEISNPIVNYDQQENIKIYFNGVASFR